MREKRYCPFFEDLDLRKRPMGNPVDLQEQAVVGMAVEVDESGYATRAVMSDGRFYSFPNDLATFFEEKDESLAFVMDRDLEPVLKWLGEELCTKLLDGFGVVVGRVQLFYHGTMSVRIAGGRSLRKFYRLRPFYPAAMLPDEYDCVLVQQLGVRLVSTLMKLEVPLRLSSYGSLLGEVYSGHVPERVLEMAYNCYHGGWVEMFKLGHFKEAYDYDVASAYPSEAARLVGMRGAWYSTNHWVQGAEYGFCYAKISMDMNLPLSPLMFRLVSRMARSYPYRVVRNPIGVWEGWVTKDEVEFVVSNYLGDVEIEEGWWFEPSSSDRPFATLVAKLFALRKKGRTSGDMLVANVGKLMAAALQGRFMQSYLNRGERVVGPAFNPVYAATITSRVRCKVAQVAMDNYEDVLGVMVDGVLATKPLGLKEGWHLDHTGECVVANHGDYWIEGRATKRDLRKDLEEHRWKVYYPLREERRVSLAESIRSEMFELAGHRSPPVFSQVSKVGKRFWEAYPKVCNDLLTKVYESYPLLPGASQYHP